jgi:hypothetical protein
MRFAGAVLLFLGILAAVGILTALMVFADPLAVPQSELIRGWLIILGAVAAAATVLLAVAAPRAGYRWFDAVLFLVPVFGQVIFAPRILWLGSRSKAQRPRTEPILGPRGEPSGTAASVGERAEPPDPERIREEARTLAALLSGRRQITVPGPRGANGRAATVAASPEPSEAPQEPAAPPVGVVEEAVSERAEETELSARVAELRTELALMRAELELLRQQLRSLEDHLRRGR